MTGTQLRRLGRGLLAAYLACGAFIFFWPYGSVIHRLNLDLWLALRKVGLPRWITPDHTEQIFNFLAFAIPVVIALAVFPGLRVWHVVVAGVGASMTIELVQGYLLDSRNMDWLDFTANSLGVVAGAAAAVFLRRAETSQRVPKGQHDQDELV